MMPKAADRAQPTTMPARIGTRRNSPRPSVATSSVATSELIEMMMAVVYGMALSPLPPMAMPTATGDSARPMEMITGAITTGGSRRSMKPAPRSFTARLIRM